MGLTQVICGPVKTLREILAEMPNHVITVGNGRMNMNSPEAKLWLASPFARGWYEARISDLAMVLYPSGPVAAP